MDLGLLGKRALVCGSSSGLGAACAIELAREGVHVYINGTNPHKLAKIEKQIKTSGGSVESIEADLTTKNGIETIKNAINDIDILVANSGGPPPGQFRDWPEEQWQEAEKLVLFSARETTGLVIDNMIEKKWGRLIYITSIGVLQPINDLILSNTYRAAVTAMCKTISNNYAINGITANCVCPGFTATERLTNLAQARAEDSNTTAEAVLESFASQIPAGRIGKPNELASLVTFLASDRASYITGCSIPVDGGWIKSLV